MSRFATGRPLLLVMVKVFRQALTDVLIFVGFRQHASVIFVTKYKCDWDIYAYTTRRQ